MLNSTGQGQGPLGHGSQDPTCITFSATAVVPWLLGPVRARSPAPVRFAPEAFAAWAAQCPLEAPWHEQVRSTCTVPPAQNLQGPCVLARAVPRPRVPKSSAGHYKLKFRVTSWGDCLWAPCPSALAPAPFSVACSHLTTMDQEGPMRQRDSCGPARRALAA